MEASTSAVGNHKMLIAIICMRCFAFPQFKCGLCNMLRKFSFTIVKARLPQNPLVRHPYRPVPVSVISEVWCPCINHAYTNWRNQTFFNIIYNSCRPFGITYPAMYGKAPSIPISAFTPQFSSIVPSFFTYP